MWKGPCARLLAAHHDTLWHRVHRRNMKLGIACEVSNDGRTASFYSISKKGGDWYRHDLGRVEGPDPILNSLWGSHSFTAPDAELFALHHEYLARLLDEVRLDAEHLAKRIANDLFDLEDVIASVRA